MRPSGSYASFSGMSPRGHAGVATLTRVARITTVARLQQSAYPIGTVAALVADGSGFGSGCFTVLLQEGRAVKPIGSGVAGLEPIVSSPTPTFFSPKKGGGSIRYHPLPEVEREAGRGL